MNANTSQLSLFSEPASTEPVSMTQVLQLPCASGLTSRLATQVAERIRSQPNTRVRLIGPNRRSRDTLAQTVETTLGENALAPAEPIVRQTWAAFCFEWLQAVSSSWVLPQALESSSARVMMLREADVLTLAAQLSHDQPEPLRTLGQSPQFVHQLLDWCGEFLLGNAPEEPSLFQDPHMAQWAQQFLRVCLTQRSLAYGWLAPLLQVQLQHHPDLVNRLKQRVDWLVVDDAHQLGPHDHDCLAVLKHAGIGVVLGSHIESDTLPATPTSFGVFASPEDEADTIARYLLQAPKPWASTTIVCWDAEAIQRWVDALSRQGIPCVGAMVAVGTALVIEQSRLAVTWLALEDRLSQGQRTFIHDLWQQNAPAIHTLEWSRSTHDAMNEVWTLAVDWLSLSADPQIARFLGALALWEREENAEESASAQQRWAQWLKLSVNYPELLQAIAPLLQLSQRYAQSSSLTQSLSDFLKMSQADATVERAVGAMLKRVERWESLARQFNARAIPALALPVFDYFWQPAAMNIQGADWNPLDTAEDEFDDIPDAEFLAGFDGVQLLLPKATWGHRNHRVILPSLTLANDGDALRQPILQQGLLTRATGERWLTTVTHIEGRQEPVSAMFIRQLAESLCPWVNVEVNEIEADAEPGFTPTEHQPVSPQKWDSIQRLLPSLCREQPSFERALGALSWPDRGESESAMPPRWLTASASIEAKAEAMPTSLWLQLPDQRELAEPILGDHEPLHLSATSLDSYANCPRQFYYRHMLKIKTPAGPQALHGVWVHRILENFHTACEQNRLTMTAADLSQLSHDVLVPDTTDREAVVIRLNTLGFKDEELQRLWDLPVLIRQDWLTHILHVIRDWEQSGWFRQPIRQVRAEFGFTDRPLVGVDNAMFTGKIDSLLQYESGQWHVVDYKVYGHSKFTQTKDDTRRQKLMDSYLKTIPDAAIPHTERFPTGIAERSYQIPLYYMAMESVEPALFEALQTVSLQIIRPSLAGSPQLGPIAVSLDKSELDAMLPHMRAVIQEAFVNAIRQTTMAETNTQACTHCGFTAMCDAVADPEAADASEEAS